MLDADKFNMWRALCCFAVCDNELTLEEQKILTKHLKEEKLSDVQKDVLRQDLKQPQNIEECYKRIRMPKNKKRFCELARTLVWCDGDIKRQEKEILKKLSCLGNKENKAMFVQSGTGNFIKDYAKKYEDIAFMNDNVRANLLQVSV